MFNCLDILCVSQDIVDGVSANSPEAIELNLARATKSGGLKKVRT